MTQQQQRLTFAAAKTEVSRLTPPPDATPDQRRAHHQHAAELYRQAAENDPVHYHEAMAYAYVEREIYARRVGRTDGQA